MVDFKVKNFLPFQSDEFSNKHFPSHIVGEITYIWKNPPLELNKKKLDRNLPGGGSLEVSNVRSKK